MTDIRKLQESLKAKGFDPGPVDGRNGIATKRAVRAFQKATGLTVDGIAGKQTLAALEGKKADPVQAAGFSIDARSERNLQGVNKDLVKVVRRAAELSEIPFTVTEGLRTIERQRQLVAKGASKTMKSRHLTGHAVDLAAKVGGQIRWDWPLYGTLAEAMKSAAKELGVPITWGGDWKSFKDGPHFQLKWASYP